MDPNWVHFAHRPSCVVTWNSNLAILKPEFIFSKSERIIWAYSFVTKNKQTNKANGFLLFLKAFSWEADLWVRLGDFTLKKKHKQKK